METQQIKKERKKFKKSLALFVLGYLFFALVLIAGCVLIGVGYKSFVAYDNLLQYWLSHGGTWSNFHEQLANYNNNLVGANEWGAKASIDLFAPGITLLIVGAIGIIVLIIFHFKKPKINE
ncbi:hypothetical protein [Malacoplasma muris]|uniref:hypothetical protein n=1 Tax=Malacoplasma muris TaxID=2119 RepID=UPI00398E3A12